MDCGQHLFGCCHYLWAVDTLVTPLIAPGLRRGILGEPNKTVKGMRLVGECWILVENSDDENVPGANMKLISSQ